MSRIIAAANQGYMELYQALSDLDRDDALDLIAIAWLGRDGARALDFAAARDLANRQHCFRPELYLLSAPHLGDDLERGLTRLMLRETGRVRNTAVENGPSEQTEGRRLSAAGLRISRPSAAR
jgi:hypothetical protein